MQIIERRITELVPYARNPRKNDAAVAQVANSIREFGFKVPIVIDKDNVIVAGHTRLKAAESLGLEIVPCIVADDLTDEQIKAFRLADNKTAELAEWDFDLLNAELEDIEDIDMEEFGFDFSAVFDTDDKYSDGVAGALAARFVVPPFSYLDTRQSYWQERKRAWLEKTGNLSETRDGDYGRFAEAGLMESINSGTSNFDPVLAELVYRWFSPAGGKVLDPFAGEQTKGIVAGELGLEYVGVDIRADQIATDSAAAAHYKDVRYICGDSTKISKIIKERDFDLCFTSPPYYDLEVYSKEDLSALGTYQEFMRQYKNIFSQCAEMLRDDSFLVVKVGEIRNKKTGEYRSFVADNINLFIDLGLKYYNELVLLHPAGTAPLRANKSMEARKIVKLHQNILVFYKGDLANIKNRFQRLTFDEQAED